MSLTQAEKKALVQNVLVKVEEIRNAFDGLDDEIDALETEKEALGAEPDINNDDSKTAQLFDMIENVVSNFKETKMCLDEIPEDFEL